MFYEYPITVPANTQESDPLVEYLRIAHGVIQRMYVQFPTGCAGLVHCRLDYCRLLSFPADLTKSIASDGFIVPIEGPYEIYVEPYRIEATLWNTDDTYDHTITIRIDMVEAQEVLMFAKILAGLSKFLKLVGVKV